MVHMSKVKAKIYREMRKKIKLNKFLNELKKNEHNIILFGSPYHSNMGDHAQTYCILNWLKSNYPGYKVHVFTLLDCDESLYSSIRKNIKKDDKIFFHSGYHLTDIYREQDVYVRIAELFPDYKITIFPQTINYLDKKNEDITANIFNKHGNINLLCRDEISYKTAQSKFQRCKLYLYPDIVTSLIGTRKFYHQRNGILFCMRNDREAFYNK